MDGSAEVSSLIEGLQSANDSTRQLSAFQLKSSVTKPAFVSTFVNSDGLRILDRAIQQEDGKTLTYALGALASLLQQGYKDLLSIEVVTKTINLVVSRAANDSFRYALRILVIATRLSPGFMYEDETSHNSSDNRQTNSLNLRPLIKNRQGLLEAVVVTLSSPDYSLCTPALEFLNELIKDSSINLPEYKLMRFVRKLHEQDVFTTVEKLMRRDDLTGIAEPLLVFQNSVKVMLKSWRDISIDRKRQAHQDALAHIKKAAAKIVQKPDVSEVKHQNNAQTNGDSINGENVSWQSAGFTSESPEIDLAPMGLLGLMDLADFVRKNPGFYQRILLDQSVLPETQRCPIAKVSVSVTHILYDHFEIATSPEITSTSTISRDEAEKSIKPLLLTRDRLHNALTHAFLRIWSAAEADSSELNKIEKLVRLLAVRMVGGTTRRTSVREVEQTLSRVTLEELRKWQLDSLGIAQTSVWSQSLRSLQSTLRREASDFIREQRINCLLRGEWFRTTSPLPEDTPPSAARESDAWRFVKLSPSRRYLHHAVYPVKPAILPIISDLPQRIDVTHINSVVSRSWPAALSPTFGTPSGITDGERKTVTRLLIMRKSLAGENDNSAAPLLDLLCPNATVIAEWLDGINLLVGLDAATEDTAKLIRLVEDWSLKVRMLNLSKDDVVVGKSLDRTRMGNLVDKKERDEIGKDYWYDMDDS